jgi:hypothetical protein
MTDLLGALDELSQLLEEEQIPHAVMGGLAVRVYGIPRATFDLDFTLSLPRDDLPRLYDLLEARGYTVPEAYRKGWLDVISGPPLVKYRLLAAGRTIDLDFFLAESEFQKSVLSRKRRERVNGCLVWLVSPEDLILLKLIAGRARDMADIADVLFTQGQLDRPYMERWASELGVRDKFDQIWRESVSE